MSPLIPFIREIIPEFFDINSHLLRLSRFNLVKVMLYPRMTLYSRPMFAYSFLMRCTHYDIYLPSRILSISASPVLTLNILTMIFVASLIIVDYISVQYVAIRSKYSETFLIL